MKLFRKSVYAMAIPRNRGLQLIERECRPLVEHVAKVCLYQDTTNSLDHWLKEISEYLDIVCDAEIKTSSQRLKAKDYLKLLDAFGETRHDVSVMLRSFNMEFASKYYYVDIDQNVVDQGFQFIYELRDYVGVNFPLRNHPTKSEIQFAIGRIYARCYL